MKTRSRWLLLAVPVFASSLLAQEPITIQLSFEKKLDGNGIGFVHLFEYGGDGRLVHEGNEHTVKPPELDENAATGYGFVYFAGQPQGVLDRSIAFLVEGFDTPSPRFFVDLNNNLDFTDDAPAVEREVGTAKHLLTLHAAGHPDRRFTVRLGALGDTMDADRLGDYVTMFASYLKRMGGVATKPEHWFSDQRLNVLSASTEVDGVSVQIGLHDYDCNGSYADAEDMVLMGEFEGEYLSRAKSSGATVLGGDALIRIGEQTYEVTEADPAGQFVRVQVSDKPYTRLIDGVALPEFELTMFDGEAALLSSFVAPGKLLLIDFWGHWCAGCIAILPALKVLNEKAGDRLTILGIHNGDHDKAREIIETEGMAWKQAQVTDELIKAFMVDKWPYYVLVGGDGRIQKINADITEVLKIAEAEVEKVKASRK